MSDPMEPPRARYPAQAIELVAAALSDGDLESAVAQYEPGAVVQLWAGAAGPGSGQVRRDLRQVMDLRLPVRAEVELILPGPDLGLLLCHRQVHGRAPDREQVFLSGAGAVVVRRSAAGVWRIAADAWRLAGSGARPHCPEPSR